MIELNYHEFLLLWGLYAIVWISGIGLGYGWCYMRNKELKTAQEMSG